MASPSASHPSQRTERRHPGLEIWHIDTTLIRLLDGTRVYLHAIIGNFSRRILSWRLNDHFDPGTSADLLVEAGRGLVADASPPMLLADGDVEEHNTRLPHSAFRGQTPDEMYRGRGREIPDGLAAAKQDARRRRLDVNRAARCVVCA